MALPDEDLGPAWLRDYGQIEADIAQMEEFAAKLAAEVQQNYEPHASSVHADMTAPPPQPHAYFPELVQFMNAHRDTIVAASDNVYYYTQDTNNFATAATEISRRYRDSDAFSSARVRDVNAAFDGFSGTAVTNDSGREVS